MSTFFNRNVATWLFTAAACLCVAACDSPSEKELALESACKKGNMKACVEYGNSSYFGENGVRKSLGTASWAFKKACDANVASACRAYGMVEEETLPKAEYHNEAARLIGDATNNKLWNRIEQAYTKACRLGDDRGCKARESFRIWRMGQEAMRRLR